jgi:hypothetical protein
MNGQFWENTDLWRRKYSRKLNFSFVYNLMLHLDQHPSGQKIQVSLIIKKFLILIIKGSLEFIHLKFSYVWRSNQVSCRQRNQDYWRAGSAIFWESKRKNQCLVSCAVGRFTEASRRQFITWHGNQCSNRLRQNSLLFDTNFEPNFARLEVKVCYVRDFGADKNTDTSNCKCKFGSACFLFPIF